MLYFLNIFEVIGNHYKAWKDVYDVIGTILSIMLIYKTAYKTLASGKPFTHKNANSV